MAIQPVPNYTPVPTPVIQRGDRETFSNRVDTFISWLQVAPPQFKALADVTYNNANEAAAAADSAVDSAIAAGESETSASAAAATALSTVPVTSATPPPSPAPNAVWIHANTGREYTYLQTANGYQWVETAASVVYASPTSAEDQQFTAGGTGAVPRSTHDKLSDTISVKDFGALGDGVADDTVRIQAAINAARTAGLPLKVHAGTFRTSAPLDISGIIVHGSSKGYRNANGTVIVGAGNHDIFQQATATAATTRTELHNLRIKGGLIGVKLRYVLHSEFSNIHVTDCVDGIQFGNSADSGGLFCTFENIEVDVTGTALDVNGNQFVNANSFNQCFFKGNNYGARVRCTGGLGAVSNVFNDCEFAGDRFGIELDNTSNTILNEPYFESIGPSVHLIGTRNIGFAINDPVFALLENTNATGKNAYVYHAGSGIQKGTIKGGWVYVPAAAKYNNLSLVASESPANFFLTMHDYPEMDVTASGFTVLNGLLSQNLSITTVGAYTPAWTSSGTAPAIGNGTITGNYSRVGNSVTATIKLTAGSTTTFGTGNYSFALPFPCAKQAAGHSFILDSGTGYFSAVMMANDNDSTVEGYIAGTANLLSATQPMTWAPNDSITITMTYQC